MSFLWHLFFPVIAVGTLSASIRIAFVARGHPPANKLLAFLTHELWLINLVVLLPLFIGSVARGEVSALPWSGFLATTASLGIAQGVTKVLLVLIPELWLLWIPSRAYVLNHPDLDRRSVVLAYCLNLAVGLLLLTQHNPIYGLFEHVSTGAALLLPLFLSLCAA